MANLERARQFGRVLTKLGCRLALDDFGAAFGSFYYLKHLPVDLLKIAGEYVRGLGMEHDPADRLIIEAVVKLAKGLGTMVVAEFVGDQETRQELLAMGVRLGQGPSSAPPGTSGRLKVSNPRAPCKTLKRSHRLPKPGLPGWWDRAHGPIQPTPAGARCAGQPQPAA